jgi:hypothetical protein
MTRKQFSIFTSTMALSVALAILVGLAAFRPLPVKAQSTVAPVILLQQMVSSVSACAVPTGNTLPNSAVYCTVNSGTLATSGLYVSYNGGLFVPAVASSSGPSYTATSPIVLTGTVISCPSCATTSAVVNSFNGRTGNVQLTKADVISTGPVAAVPASTAPLQ